MQPTLLHRDRLVLAGMLGDGADTAALWAAYDALDGDSLLAAEAGADHYELRLCGNDGSCTCLVGVQFSGDVPPRGFTKLALPPSAYASFDVRVAEGYDSQNRAMDQWLEENPEGYREALLDGRTYVIERYGERFCGDAPESIVEIQLAVRQDPL